MHGTAHFGQRRGRKCRKKLPFLSGFLICLELNALLYHKIGCIHIHMPAMYEGQADYALRRLQSEIVEAMRA